MTARFTSVGIIIYHDDYRGWWGTVKYDDMGHCVPDSLCGELRTKYAQASLDDVIDKLIYTASELGIEWYEPSVWAIGDGENVEHPMPEGWRDELSRQALRVGWRPAYNKMPAREVNHG